jgi:hypothetical protein
VNEKVPVDGSNGGGKNCIEIAEGNKDESVEVHTYKENATSSEDVLSEDDTELDSEDVPVSF